MTIDTTKESVCINQLVDQESESRAIEGDMIVPDIKPDILSIIKSNGIVCIYKKETLDGKLKIDGAILLHIIYSADDETESCHCLNASLDFSEIIQMPNAKQDMTLVLKTHLNNIETKILNGRKINIKCNIGFDIKLFSNDNIDIIKQIDGVDDLQKLCYDVEVSSLVGNGYTKAYAKETVPIDPADNLAEVLDTEILVINKDVKISYNKALVKADVCIKTLYITEDNNINSCQSTIPLMGFIDIQNINEENTCDIDFELKNLHTKPNGEEEHSIYVEAEFEISCFTFERKNLTIIEDLYSPKLNLRFNYKNINLIGSKIKNADICMIKEKVLAHELINSKICDIAVNPVISNQKTYNNQVSFDGNVYLNILYYNDNNSILNAKELEVPFEFAANIDGLSASDKIDTQIYIKRKDFVISPEGYLDMRIDLEFEISSSNVKEISVIDEIVLEENSNKEDYSMVIYFAKADDTLWKIAKKFGSTEDEIKRINGIEGLDITEGEKQLYIPRYSARQQA